MNSHTSKKFISRRFFTLIEVLIALGLTSIIMSTLTYFYFQIQSINTKTEKSLKKLYELSYLENRLSEVIPKALAENTPKKDFYFYTSELNSEYIKQGSPSLVFMYDNGIDINKALSNNTLGRLFVDNKRRLILATWPSPKRWKEGSSPIVVKEVLAENVDSISFKFFVAPDIDRNKVPQSVEGNKKKQQSRPEPHLAWISEWKNEFNELPAIMKISLQRGPENIEYSFPLPNSTKTIFYNQ
ncbi:MAG: hypothetical protein WC222_06560 [Parachlamydiales bacterium]|jgi:type II secretory pathway component PulJ